MTKPNSTCLVAALLLGLVTPMACTDYGGSSAVPGYNGSLSSDGGAHADATVVASDASGVESGVPDGALDSTHSPDATTPDPTPPDAWVADTGGGTTVDAFSPEASVEDASNGGTPDAATTDAALIDSGSSRDAGGSFDSGSTDSGGVDAGADGALSPPDASGGDAHIDAISQTDAGALLVPCTTPGQTGCVLCQYNGTGGAGNLPNTGMLCTSTEAALVQHDIARGTASSAGPDPANSCYDCAVQSGCLDDSQFNDQGHECDDLPEAEKGLCMATLTCVLGSSCAWGGTLPASAVSSCYCGTAPVSGTCAAVGGTNAANGPCKAAEAAGLKLSGDDGLDILKNFTSTTLPSGVANNVFQCAVSNGCTACLQ